MELRFDPRVRQFFDTWKPDRAGLEQEVEGVVALARYGAVSDGSLGRCQLLDRRGPTQHWIRRLSPTDAAIEVWVRPTTGGDRERLEVVGVGINPGSVVPIAEGDYAWPKWAAIFTNGPRAWACVRLVWQEEWHVFVKTVDPRRWPRIAMCRGVICRVLKPGQDPFPAGAEAYLRELAGPPAAADEPPAGLAAVPISRDSDPVTVEGDPRVPLARPVLLEVAAPGPWRWGRPYEPAELAVTWCKLLPYYARPL